jgi:hypothetical protein
MNELLKSVIEKLTLKTENKKAHWERTGESEFRIQIAGSAIITRMFDGGWRSYDVSIYNDDSERIAHSGFIPEDDARKIDLIKKLYDVASTSCNEFYLVCNAILNELNSEEEIGIATNNE